MFMRRVPVRHDAIARNVTNNGTILVYSGNQRVRMDRWEVISSTSVFPFDCNKWCADRAIDSFFK